MKNFQEYFNLNEAVKNKKNADKSEEPIRIFSVGDILVANNKDGKIPEEALDFLNTYSEYEVLEVKENGKLNLGCRVCHNEDGKEKDFLFSPKRFRLKGEENSQSTKPKKKDDSYRKPLDEPDNEYFDPLD